LAFDFPTSPAINDKYTDAVSGTEYVWNGVAWDLSSGGELQDYLPLAGGTMVGPIVMGEGAGIHWANTNAQTDRLNFSEGICLYGYGGTSKFGWTITSGTLNYIVENIGNRHDFWCGTVNALRIEDQGSTFTGSIDASGHIQSNGGGIYSTGAGNINARSGSKFQFTSDDNNAWRNAISFGSGFHIQYIQGGNNDGRVRFYTANGGYSDQPVFETTVVNGMPGCNFTGRVIVGSGDSYGMMIGDRWHGWAWSNTANCEHLRSYQGAFQFLKCANTADGAGEALALINSAGVSTQSVSGSSFYDRSLADRPELAEFVEGEDDVPLPTDMVVHIPRRGVNLGKLLLRALARIDALEAELKKRR
jgi:hypothetical protein